METNLRYMNMYVNICVCMYVNMYVCMQHDQGQFTGMNVCEHVFCI